MGPLGKVGLEEWEVGWRGLLIIFDRRGVTAGEVPTNVTGNTLSPVPIALPREAGKNEKKRKEKKKKERKFDRKKSLIGYTGAEEAVLPLVWIF